MKKFKRWFQVNVLKKQELPYKVYFSYDLTESTYVHLDIVAKSKVEARTKAERHIQKYAVNPEFFTFLKVVEA